MHSAYENLSLGSSEGCDTLSATPASDKYITIPHRNGDTRVQVSIETINKFGGSWSLESALWH
jgi:hypothetical protein